MLKLHGLDISGNTYKIKLLMSLLQLDYTFLALDISNRQHKTDNFLKLNPRGEYPVLEDDAGILEQNPVVIWDSQAILIYLAQKYTSQNNNPHWYPASPIDMAHITQWLCVANNEIFHSLGKARSMLKFGYAGDLNLYQKKGRQTLDWIELHLSRQVWLVSTQATNQPSIADIACYPYIALCEEAEISLQHYPAILRWFKQIESLDGYISMPGIASQSQT